MDKFVEAEILATCNALGIVIRGVYEKGSDCLECLKDLLRYLRKDDETHSVLRFLGHNNLLENDLLPLIKHYEDESEIFDFTLRLLVALSSPALLIFQEDIPEDKESHNIYLQLVNYLQNYKRAFCDLEVWKVFHRQLTKILEKRPIERTEEEGLILERMLIIIRNILHVPTHELTSFQTDDDMSLQDHVIWQMHVSKVDILMMYLCSNDTEYNYCLHMIEIISLMLQEHSPETLAATNEARSEKEKEKDLDSLMAVRRREQNLKMKKVQSMVSPRFNGVYCVKNMKSLSSNDYISHKLITNLDDVKFDDKKTGKRIPKNRVPLKDVNTTRRSTLIIRLFLKKFCTQFLRFYNKLMAGIKRELDRKVSSENDDSYYLWAIEYFMKFNRLTIFNTAYIAETISVHMFHHIQSQITMYQEMMITDKKKSALWSKRMRLGVSAYKELLQTVFAMTKSKDPVLQHNGDKIVTKVFYVIEYREMLLSLLTNFDEVKFSLTYLSELIESNHMFLKMLENHSKRHSEIIVQQKKRKVKRRKKKKPQPQQPKSIDLESEWSGFASSLSAAVQGRLNVPNESFPFDGASEVPFEEQKVDAMYKIRHALVSKQAAEAVSLLRSARELWPDGDSFGTADIDSEDEFMVLREIFMSNIENPHPETSQVAENEPESTDEETENMPALTEKKLDIEEVYKKYASLKVVQPCCLLLANYQNNSPTTNVSLIKLLHKIAWDCKMHALFFQSTLFLTFQKIFNDPDVSTNPVTKELYRFAKFILSKFFEVAQKNDKVFVEMLFWKGLKEAYELEEGYDTGGRPIKGAWTEKEENELIELYEENKDVYIEGQDVADIILASIENRERTKHQITLALKRLGLIQSSKDLKPHLRKEWKEDEVIELQNLFEDLKGSDDVMGGILNGLSIKRSRKLVVEKLLELNLIQDKKEVLKKRSKKSKTEGGNESEDSFIENSDDDEHAYSESDRHRKPGEDSSENEGDEENFFKMLKEQRAANKEAVSNVDSKDVYEGLEEQGETAELVNIFKSKKASRNEKHKQAKKDKNILQVWQEQEIIELTNVFNSNRDSPDIMNVIMSSLTTKRSKQSVVEKLLETGLIKDKNEIRKKQTLKTDKNGSLDVSSFVVSDNDAQESGSEDEETIYSSSKKHVKKARQVLSDSEEEASNGNKDKVEFEAGKNKAKKSTSTPNDGQKSRKRPPKVWDEVEIVQLQQLFEKFKDSSDVIGDIMSELTVKRPKPNIIEKLLEIKLIDDKKQVRKKRQKQDKTPKLKKKDKNEGNETPDIYKNEYKKRKEIKNSILSDSSDDETSLLVTKTKNHVEGKKNTKARNSILSDSSEVETVPLGNNPKQSSKKLESKFNSVLSDDSDDDLPLRNIQNKNSAHSLEKTNLTEKLAKAKRPKGIIRNSIVSDSSEDETVPLSKIHHTISEKRNAPVLSKDYEDDLPLKSIQNINKDDSIAKQADDSDDDLPLRSFQNINKDDDSDDDLPLRSIQNINKSKTTDKQANKLSSKKEQANGHNNSTANLSSKSQPEEYFQVLYDSSEDDDEMSENGSAKKRIRKKTVTQMLTDTPGSDPLATVQSRLDHSDDESRDSGLKNSSSTEHKNDSSSTVRKRKRLILDESEDSGDDDHSMIETETNNTSQLEEIVSVEALNRQKKKARVLMDSDDSD